jgi:hypothetical protein
MKRPIVNWHRIGGCADSNYTEYLQDVIRQQEKYITKYKCGSSDYDQRPNTFKQTIKCRIYATFNWR